MKRLRVIVVEDNAVIGMLLTELITAMGHEVCALERTEDDAVSKTLRCRPDLMIVDAQLGKGSGVAAVEAVLRTRSVPHIFISGAAVDVHRTDSIVLRKPFIESDLALAIERAVGTAAA
ncbi:response regulator [Roseomonas sp. HF4]|uniref:response regulator n=1 Tax=Roseomonas sp. HF4 TaxID=2562313 RepID=UPI0010BFA0CE|nr:response regulator [Roseomonas sp. HF4]